MKIQINAEGTGEDSVQAMIDGLAKQGVVAKPEDVKVQVWSEKAGKFIDFEAKNVKFIFNK